MFFLQYVHFDTCNWSSLFPHWTQLFGFILIDSLLLPVREKNELNDSLMVKCKCTNCSRSTCTTKVSCVRFCGCNKRSDCKNTFVWCLMWWWWYILSVILYPIYFALCFSLFCSTRKSMNNCIHDTIIFSVKVARERWAGVYQLSSLSGLSYKMDNN